MRVAPPSQQSSGRLARQYVGQSEVHTIWFIRDTVKSALQLSLKNIVLKSRGEPIPEESQFTIPHFGGFGPLTSTGYWANSLKRINSFPGIAVHNS